MPKPKREVPQEVVYRVAELMADEKSDIKRVADLVKRINEEFKPEPKYSREAGYRILVRARQFLKLVPPLDIAIEQELRARFELDSAIKVKVVSYGRYADGGVLGHAPDRVAWVAAELAIELLKGRVRSPGAAVGLGLGPGAVTRDIAANMGRLLHVDPDAPALKLFALASGCPARSPEVAPISFFNLFPPNLVTGQLGLFSETLIAAKQYRKRITEAGIKEAFADKEQVALVITGLGDFAEKHDLYQIFLREGGIKLEALKKLGCIGNVQYRPFNATGPLQEPASMARPVTLFELSELQQLANARRRDVLLVARPCRVCNALRTVPLYYLLKVPALRVFSALVVDSHTARQVIQMDKNMPGHSTPMRRTRLRD